MANQQAVDKLRTLGVFPKQVEEDAEIFENYTTVYAIGEECGRRHSGCSGSQFLYFHLQALLRQPEYRAKFMQEARQTLGDLRVKPEHVEEYLGAGPDGAIVFFAEHKEYRDVPDAFWKEADQFALNRIRQWLGFE